MKFGLLIVCVLIAAGCQPVTYAAKHSLTPVMLGPITHIGPEREADANVKTEQLAYPQAWKLQNDYIGGGMEGNQTAQKVVIGGNRIDTLVAPSQANDIFRRFQIKGLRCHGYTANWLIMYLGNNECHPEAISRSSRVETDRL
ncbi:MAG: hypothetical protein AAGJ56_09790 [Myxococcota bacterium]